MIFDHMHLDIVIDTSQKKITTFPKKEMDDEVYDSQNKYFMHLQKAGIIIPESIRAGNVYASLEAYYPDAVDDGVSASQVVLLSTTKFIEEQKPQFETVEYIEYEIENRYVDPTDEDSTELGEVPEAPKKGSIGPNRIRRYLSGYGYYE
ncbi:uncharacterized protein METZ01_LOCUS384988 [marine metagenome]|uniref:Uncharacterized protein n=1 Tax=marine metagenome TaxID=408172 RepID=A0A382UCY5_9ZZZZ